MAQKIIEPVYLMARGLKRFTATHSIPFFPLLGSPPLITLLSFLLPLPCDALICDAQYVNRVAIHITPAGL